MKGKYRILYLILMMIMLSTFLLTGCNKKYGTVNKTSTIKWEKNTYLPVFGEPADKIDFIDTSNMNIASQYLVASLKAIVNAKQPRIFSKDRDVDYYDWLKEFGYDETKVTVFTDVYALLDKYKDEVKSVIISDKKMLDSLNVACTLAGIEPALVLTNETYYKLLEKNYNFKVLENFTDKFDSPYSCYEFIYNEYYKTKKLNNKIICALNPAIGGCIRDYGIATNCAFVYFDVNEKKSKALMEKFLQEMPSGESAYLGWFPEGNEGAMVALTSKYGLVTWASDLVQNVMFLSGMKRDNIVKKDFVKKNLEKKLYVCLTFSEGDNLGSALQQKFPNLWQYEHHGEFPLSWTISPEGYYVYPSILKWFFDKADPEYTGFYTGPSGIGYNYPEKWDNKKALYKMLDRTNDVCKKIKLGIVNIWNSNDNFWIGGMTEEEINNYTKHLKDLSAIIDNSPNTQSVVKNKVFVTGFNRPYSYTTEDNETLYKWDIEASLETMNLSDDTQFLSIVGNPWCDGMKSYETMWNTYNWATTTYQDKVEFVTIEQYCDLYQQYLNK